MSPEEMIREYYLELGEPEPLTLNRTVLHEDSSIVSVQYEILPNAAVTARTIKLKCIFMRDGSHLITKI